MKRNSATPPGYRTVISFAKAIHAVVETLESRQLLSSVAPPPQPPGDGPNGGYSPAEIAQAYGFNKLTFADGTVPANGAGETIAISDAFSSPTIVNDLAVFDTQFGLNAPPSFTIVNENGGTALPAVDPGWAGEITLDVEWAHAMAPEANILLVEANAATNDDLLATVNYARHVPGVSVISMSWGGSEFENYQGGTISESESQVTFDPVFTTPAGHQPITFVASTGDFGSQNGVQWPSSSPNVLAVGGTSLTTSDAAGTYESEIPWAGGQEGANGGYSIYEPEPSYQEIGQQSGARSAPDVGYDADPDTGVAIYDSTPDEFGDVGWYPIGGTSDAAPQWASLIAIANQGRGLVGKPTLNGPTQVMPTLYSVYAAPGTALYSNYTAYFHDVGSDGYDTTSGLGSPIVTAVVPLLVTSPTAAPTPTPTPTLSPISAFFSQSPTTAVLEGSSGSVKLRLTNTGTTQYVGSVTVTLYASSDATVSSNDTQLLQRTFSNLKLNGQSSKVETLKFTYPQAITPGSYDLLAQTTAAAAIDTTPTVNVTPAKVSIEPATVDLATAFSTAGPIGVNPGTAENVFVTITNDGNVTATGTLGLNLYSSTDQTLDVSDQLLTSVTNHTINIRAGKSLKLRLHFVPPTGKSGGSYFLIASVTSTTSPADANAANNAAVIATA